MLLALDTATARASLALGAASGEALELPIADRRDLSRDIAAVTARLLARRGIDPRALEGVLLADGPGSFTGLRIGAAFAKGLCRALGVPLLSAPSMLGAARARAADGATVIVDYDALRGEVYRGAWRFSARGLETLAPPALAPAGAPVTPPAVRAFEADASAAALLRLVGIPGAVTTVAAPATWEPAYGRPAEAEARLLARHGPPSGA